MATSQPITDCTESVKITAIKQLLLDEVLVITLTETLIILDVTKTTANNIIVLLYIEQNK